MLIRCILCDSTEICYFHLLHIFAYEKCISLEYLIKNYNCIDVILYMLIMFLYMLCSLSFIKSKPKLTIQQAWITIR
jgi:hypothetical protein